MDNGHPPWEAYRSLMLGRLIGLDNCPRVSAVGVGETWRQILAKFVLVVTRAEAKDSYGT